MPMSRKGAFISPILLLNENPFANQKKYMMWNAFGPVSTIMPYKNLDEAIALSKKRKGFSVLLHRYGQ